MVTTTAIAQAGIAAAALLSVALLHLESPKVTHGTVVAVVPWAVVAGTLHALATAGGYPPEVSAVTTLPMGFLLTFVVATLTWAPLLQLATLRNTTVTGRYLAAAGGGVALVLVATYLLREGMDPRGFLWLSVTPLLSAFLAGTAYVLLGFVDAETLARTRLSGYVLVTGCTLVGVSVVVAVDVYAQVPSWRPVRELVRSTFDAPATATLGVGWPVAAATLVAGLVLAAGLARVVRRRETAGLLLVGTGTALTVAVGVAHLLQTTV